MRRQQRQDTAIVMSLYAFEANEPRQDTQFPRGMQAHKFQELLIKFHQLNEQIQLSPFTL